MRFEVSEVKGRRYLRYWSLDGFPVYLGPTDDKLSWRIGFTLLREDVDMIPTLVILRYKQLLAETFKPKDEDEWRKLVAELQTPLLPAVERRIAAALAGEPVKIHPRLEHVMKKLEEKRAKIRKTIKWAEEKLKVKVKTRWPKVVV